MAAKYEIGQKVIVTPVKNQLLSPRDSDLAQYAGQIGTVIHYHWLHRNAGEVFYIYTVQMESGHREIVLHEDELEAHLA